jgi:peroxiredoxin (alkyl hydroperoxide reductase subunit C)
VDEIRKLIDALQTSDGHGEATPVNWRASDKVVVPPRLAGGAEARVNERYECIAWYLGRKAL